MTDALWAVAIYLSAFGFLSVWVVLYKWGEYKKRIARMEFFRKQSLLYGKGWLKRKGYHGSND